MSAEVDFRDTAEPTAEDIRIAAALQEYQAEWEIHGRPIRSEFLSRFPEFAATLGEALDGLDLICGAIGPRARASTDHEVRPIPMRLGDFRIIREIGRGGMGIVYEAAQLSLGRRVALKVLPFASAFDERQLQRFKTEAQAAAHLHHTSIVPVFAVGSDRGVHYYAMQFIDGQTLADAIRELRRTDRTPTPREVVDLTNSPMTANGTTPHSPWASSLPQGRLPYYKALARLGVQAADALEYAHSMGIVHRDVKPANLLVDTRSNLWITDFGLAHFQGGGELTMTGDLLGTLRYMSPEQAQGQRSHVDHRTDIYSLGCSLYEVFTLREAFASRDRAELLRAIVRDDPTPPTRLRRDLPVELETIILKAMAKTPSERYGSAQELGDDLRRFLDDKPILAKRPTVRQIIAKWARRRAGLVRAATGLLVLGVIVLGIAAYLLFAAQRQTKEALVKAKENRAEARRAVDRMYRFAADKLLGNSSNLIDAHREFLQEALEFYQRFANDEGDGDLGRLDQARTLRKIGEIRSKLGDNAGTDEALTQAVQIMERLSSQKPENSAFAKELAISRDFRGVMLYHTGKIDEALAHFRTAREIVTRLQQQEADPLYHFELCKYLNHMGAVLLEMNKYDDAGKCFVDALAQFNDFAKSKSQQSNEEQQLLATTHHHLGLVAHRQEQYDAARPEWAKSLAIRERLAKEQPNNLQNQEELAHSAQTLAILSYDSNQYEDAAAYFRQSRDGYGRLQSQNPKIVAYRKELARSCHGLARALKELGQLEQAKDVLREAVERMVQLAVDWPMATQVRFDLLCSRLDLANLCKDLGDPVEAEVVAKKAWIEATEGSNRLPIQIPIVRYNLMMLRSNLARYAHGAGRLDEAERLYREAADRATTLVAEYPKTLHYRLALVGVHNNYGDLLEQQERYDLAAQAFQFCLSQLELSAQLDPKSASERQCDRAWEYVRLAHLQEKQKHPQKAAEFYASAANAVRLALEKDACNRQVQLRASWFFAACPHADHRDARGAAEMAKAVIQAEPTNSEAFRALGLSQLREGRPADAIESLLISRKHGHDPNLHLNLLLAIAYHQIGDRTLAHDEFEKACRQVAASRDPIPDIERFWEEARAIFQAGV